VDYSKLTSPRVVKALMREYEIRFKKRFGQNFLVDGNILSKIIASAELRADQYAVEIGTGLGTLTHALAQECRKVITFEIDHDLVQIFRENSSSENIHLIAGDALQYDWHQVLVGGQPSLLSHLTPNYESFRVWCWLRSDCGNGAAGSCRPDPGSTGD